jgi:hypothetical protein
VPRSVTKNGADVGGEGARQLEGVGPLELRPTGHPEGSVDVNMAGLLCRLLAIPNKEGKTRAQLVAEGWIDDAVKGDHRAILDVFDRSEKGRPAETSAADALPHLKGQTISEILEVLSRDGQDPAGD